MRGGKRLDAAKMSAIRADARHNPWMAVEQDCDIATLRKGRYRFGALDQRALVDLGETQEQRGNIGGIQRRINIVGE
jgi:hypothetical protein